jgi:multidrug efflux pump subunit AcrB
MRIRTPDGEEVPFESVADVSFGQSYSSIARLNRARTITVLQKDSEHWTKLLKETGAKLGKPRP